MKWEYKVITVDQFLGSGEELTIEEKLNKYGADGWELTGIFQKPYVTIGNSSKLECDSVVFKRAVNINYYRV